jgi:hypothetical protein
MSATASNTLGASGRADEEKSRATGSATGETSRARTLSNVGSEADLGMQTILPGATTTRFSDFPNAEDVSSVQGLRALVERLEQLLEHPKLRSPQQPTSTARFLQQRSSGSKFDPNLQPHTALQEIEALIAQACAGHPENRTRLASMTQSARLRQKILGHQPQGGRAAGCATLGASHSWRREKLTLTFTDHNWPKVAINPHGSNLPGSFLPGGDHRHSRLLRCSADQLPLNHTLELPPAYTISKDRKQGRFYGCRENGELDKHFVQLREAPGPGAYFKSLPRGPHFPMDGADQHRAETIVMGANHPFPWKSPMGNYVNPVDCNVQSVHHAPAKYTFSKTRRACSETFLGHGQQDGGPVKSDQGCLSPGHIYEHCSSFRPGVPLQGKRRTKSTPSMSKPRMRCQPVPPEPEAVVVQNVPGGVTDDDIAADF